MPHKERPNKDEEEVKDQNTDIEGGEKDKPGKAKKRKKGGIKTDYSHLMTDPKVEAYQESDPLDASEEKELILQIEKEYEYCKSYAEPEMIENLRRLKLYNNQKRDPTKIGDPLLFTILQTVLSALYEDKLSVEWAARELGDNDTSENLDELAEYDYEVMEKSKIDYDWIWNACFFGRGLVTLDSFDRELMTPIPEVIDPTTFLRDPRGTSVNGNRYGKGALRFMGSEITMTLLQMEGNPAFYNLDKVKSEQAGHARISSKGDFRSLLWEAREARAEASNMQEWLGTYAEDDLGDNREYELLEWRTFFKGKRCLVTLGNDRSVVVRYQESDLDIWPILDRPLYPTAGDWKGTSIPDIVSDKQRMRAIIQNLMVDNVKSDLFPMYVYDSRRIKNRADLNFEFNKAIPVEGPVDGAIQPINKANPNSVVADYILSTLDLAAQKATATPEVAQGVMPSQQRTLGELNMVSQSSSARYSLTSRVFGWSEKGYWRLWYGLYKRHFDEYIDQKIIRLVGSSTPKVRTLTRENIISPIDPDVKIVSKVESEAKRLQDLVRFEKYSELVMADPSANSKFVLKHLGKLNDLPKDMIAQIFPPTIDELSAAEENREINQNDLPKIKDTDNHAVHLNLHMGASETPAKQAHILAHKEALRLMKEQPSLFPNASPEELAQAQGGQGLIPGGEQSVQAPGGTPGGGIAPGQAAAAPTQAVGA